jgi:hypothetical protein
MIQKNKKTIGLPARPHVKAPATTQEVLQAFKGQQRFRDGAFVVVCEAEDVPHLRPIRSSPNHSDAGLDLVERLLKGIMEQTKPEVIDVTPTKALKGETKRS